MRSASSCGPSNASTPAHCVICEAHDSVFVIQVVNLLNDIPGVTCQSPGGAFYAWPNVTEACRVTGCRDSEEFRQRLLTEAGVAVLADIHFGPRAEGEGQHIRLSYAASDQAIREGVGRIKAFVAKGNS